MLDQTTPRANSVLPRLSERDRALMLAVGQRDFTQGKITPEEYHAILERCRIDHLAPLRGLFQRLTRASGAQT